MTPQSNDEPVFRSEARVASNRHTVIGLLLVALAPNAYMAFRLLVSPQTPEAGDIWYAIAWGIGFAAVGLIPIPFVLKRKAKDSEVMGIEVDRHHRQVRFEHCLFERSALSAKRSPTVVYSIEDVSMKVRQLPRVGHVLDLVTKSGTVRVKGNWSKFAKLRMCFQCVRCSYDMRGALSMECPECGFDFDERHHGADMDQTGSKDYGRVR